MQHWRNALRGLIASHRKPRRRKPGGLKRLELLCHELEERVTPAHFGALSHVATAAYAQVAHHATGTTTQLPTTPTSPGNISSDNSTSSAGTAGRTHGMGTSSSNSALTSALQTLKAEIQSIELKSGTTVGELTAIRSAFETLSSDGLKPSSYSALRSFENNLVAQPNNATLTDFVALYTSSPTAQQTTDLTTAYNALVAAVTSANITSTDISTIKADWSAVLAAQNSNSAATFPYFTLVTGQGVGHGLGFGFGGAC